MRILIFPVFGIFAILQKIFEMLMEFSEYYLNSWNLIRIFGIPPKSSESFISRHQLEPAASSQFEWIKNHKQFKSSRWFGWEIFLSQHWKIHYKTIIDHTSIVHLGLIEMLQLNLCSFFQSKTASFHHGWRKFWNVMFPNG